MDLGLFDGYRNMRLFYDLMARVYLRTVLRRPLLALIVLFAGSGVFASYVPRLKMDASSDSLLLKNDPVLRVYDKSRLVFGSDDYVIVAFEDKDLFTREKVRFVADLSEKFRAIEGVESVLSIATERLFRSPPSGGGALGLMAGREIYLDTPACDLALARRELAGHEVYSQNLITPDGEKTSFLIYLVFTFEEKWLEKEMYSIEEMLSGGDPSKVLEISAGEFESVFAGSPLGISDALEAIGSEKDAAVEGIANPLAQARKALAAYREAPAATGAGPLSRLESPEGRALESALAALGASLSGGAAGSPALGTLRNRFLVASERWAESGRGSAMLRRLLDMRNDARWLKQRLGEVKGRFGTVVDSRRERRTAALAEIRRILAGTGRGEDFHIAGLPIIWVDMMKYIRSDMKVFGVAGAVLMGLILAAVFPRFRYVFFPLAACLAVMSVVVGLISMLDLRTTVITSNIASLLLILSMSQAIHLIVRYQEVLRSAPFLDHRGNVMTAVREVALPCFHNALTTAIGFLSMITTGIVPVIQFGQFMAFGIMLSFAVVFIVVPAGLMLFNPPPGAGAAATAASPFRKLAWIPDRIPLIVLGASAAAAIVSVAGITGFKPLGIKGLGVETVFVDYFNKDTDIYKGLMFIDQKMGGTSSLEVIMDGKREGYFAERENFAKIEAVEKFFAGLPHVGKVITVRSMTSELEKILKDNGQPPPGAGGFPPKFLMGVLAALGGRGGERAALWSFISRDFSTARVFVRIREADSDLNRNEIVAKVREFVDSCPELKGLDTQVTGIFVLYANMLNSLIGGQVNSFAPVFIVIAVIFVILFRSLKTALLAIVPDVLPIIAVLGLMGHLGVPLDMNNIMMASVALGIAVDDTIHYVIRIRNEYASCGSLKEAMYRSSGSIGKAIVLTTVVNTVGFGMLVFSNFKPTAYFGFFTAFALVAALLLVLTLLPVLIMMFKPFRRNHGQAVVEAVKGQD